MTLLLVGSYICVYVCVYIHTYTPGSEIAGSYGSSVHFLFVCLFLILQIMGVFSLFSRVIAPIFNLINSAQVFPFLNLYTNTCYWCFCCCFMCFIITILRDVGSYFILLFICISLMISDIEHLFMYLLAICVSSLEKWKCIFKSFVHFSIKFFFNVELYEFFVYFGY